MLIFGVFGVEEKELDSLFGGLLTVSQYELIA